MSILEKILEVFVEEVAERAVAKIRATTTTVAPPGPATTSEVKEPAPAPAASTDPAPAPKARKKRTPTETVVETPEKAVEAIQKAEAPAPAPAEPTPAPAPAAPTPAGAITQERVNAVREALRTYAARVAQESEGKTDGRQAALDKLAKYAPRAMDLQPGQDEALIKELTA